MFASAADFTQTLLDAGMSHVGKVKLGKNTKSWMNPAVRAKVKKRNQLRRKTKTKQQRLEWRKAWREAQDEINNAKEMAWKDALDSVVTEADDQKLWRIIKSLNGSPCANAPNEVMIVGGMRITDDKGKADKFISHYANVSNLSFNSQEREVNKQLKKALSESQRDEFPPFTISELRKAIKKMKPKGASGPDNIPPSFLKNLGPIALSRLLDIFNLSLKDATCPQLWRSAIIIPLLKAGKAASELDSYRPISLTSCIVKVLERMLAERIFFLAEENKWFSPLQGGFRKGRSCEDQILKITQAIEDGFQNSKQGGPNRARSRPKRSALALLDFSKAYDTVWRQKLLLSMFEKGVPLYIIRWIHGFLTNRLASVRYNGTTGKTKLMKQGVPQGSVLAPILFLFYINNLAEILPDSTINALYADDVSILAQHEDKEVAEAILQKSVNVVTTWSKEWKLSLNASKSEVSFFTLDTSELSFSPSILIDGTVLRHNQFPRLLGVILDPKLSFTAHTEEVIEKVDKKKNMLAAVAHSKWGWKKHQLKRIYYSHCRSPMDSSAIAWQPWLWNTDMSHPHSNANKLEKAQSRCLRVITKQSKSCPLEALRLESNIPSYQSNMRYNIIRGREKGLRLPDDHPRKKILDQHPHVGKENRPHFRFTSELLSRVIPPEANCRKPLQFDKREPWKPVSCIRQVYTSLPGIDSKNECPTRILAAAYARISELNGSITIYSDGSATEGTVNGGSAAVITRGQPSIPEEIEVLMKKGASLTCSFDEEAAAMNLAMDWLEQNHPESAVIITDSQSLCQALNNVNEDVDDLRDRICAFQDTNNLHIQWVPGHCGIAGNELADTAAKEAARLTGPSGPISFPAVSSFIRQVTRDNPPSKDPIRSVYRHISQTAERTITSREDQSLLGQVRCGQTPLFLSHKHKLDKITDPTCPRCENSHHNLTHWMQQCDGTLEKRRELFGVFGEEAIYQLESLSKYPIEAVALIKATLTPRVLGASD